MKKAFIDANIFVFAALNADSEGRVARQLLREVSEGRVCAITSSLVVDEFMWVLIKNRHAELLRRSVENVYKLANLRIVAVSAQAPLDALDFIQKYGLRPRDAIHCAVMRSEGLSTIFSDDADFDRVSGVKRIFK